jgi:hypothetical protein
MGYAWAALVVAAGVSGGEREARAWVSDSPILTPPDGWQHLCVGNTITLTPSVSERVYTGTGVCWINIAQGNRQDPQTQNWHRVPVRFEGGYALQQQRFRETIVVDTPTGKVTVATGSACSDDPWLKGAACGIVTPNVDLAASFGWALKTQQDGPLSRGVFDPAVILALTSKQASSTPNAPVDLDAVRWPEPEGKVGRIFWRAPDVSGNKWILAYDVEYSSSPDSAFAAGGKVMGPGAKSTLSPKDIPRFFYTTFPVGDSPYYFRVCSVNDAGRQCSAAKALRAPTQGELMAISSHAKVAGGALLGGGSQPPAAGAPGVPRERVAAPGAVRAPMGPVPRP